jgi:flavin prenyltransferase
MIRLIIGITGATGIIYGLRILEYLHHNDSVETHLVISKPGLKTLSYETSMKVKEVHALADYVYSNDDIGASIASGSFQTSGMIIAPCSIHTLSSIAHSLSNTLIARAADVCLKEYRRLILLVRETPLHQGHLANMLKVSQMGGTIAPPVPAFYNNPQSIDDLVKHTIGRVFDLLELEHDLVQPWKDSGNAKKR